MSKRDVFEKAINTYGADHQLNIVIEEMAELTKEICKKKRGKENHDEIIEEIADVEIMLDQLKIICGVKSREVMNVKHKKIERLIGRLENETW